MKKLADWFTQDRRQKIQLFFGSLAPLLILLGFATEVQTEQVLIIVGAVLQFVAAILSLVNLKKGDWSTAWAVIRGAIYALAATISPALVLLGVYDNGLNATILLALSLGLSTLSSILSVFVSGQQKTQEVAERASVVITQLQGEPHDPNRLF